MKTDEAPEKIYADPKVFSISDEFNELLRTKEDGYVEYTRTDVFIDKACDWLNNNLTKYSELTNEDEYGNKLKKTVMNVFYGQAVKDFQAYMKGE